MENKPIDKNPFSPLSGTSSAQSAIHREIEYRSFENDSAFRTFVTYTRNDTGDDGSSYDLQLEQIGFIPIQNDKRNTSNADSELDVSSNCEMTFDSRRNDFVDEDLEDFESIEKETIYPELSSVGLISSVVVSPTSQSSDANSNKSGVKSGGESCVKEGNLDKIKNIFTIESSEKVNITLLSDKIPILKSPQPVEEIKSVSVEEQQIEKFTGGKALTVNNKEKGVTFQKLAGFIRRLRHRSKKT